MPDAVGSQKRNANLAVTQYASTSTTGTVELKASGRLLITSIMFSANTAGSVSLEDKNANVLYTVDLNAAGLQPLPLSHPILSENGMQSVTTMLDNEFSLTVTFVEV